METAEQQGCYHDLLAAESPEDETYRRIQNYFYRAMLCQKRLPRWMRNPDLRVLQSDAFTRKWRAFEARNDDDVARISRTYRKARALLAKPSAALLARVVDELPSASKQRVLTQMYGQNGGELLVQELGGFEQAWQYGLAHIPLLPLHVWTEQLESHERQRYVSAFPHELLS
jgi:hypothetical protein